MEIALFLLEEVGSHFRSLYADPHTAELEQIETVCKEADRGLTFVMLHTDASADLKEIVETERESLAIRFPYLPIEL